MSQSPIPRVVHLIWIQGRARVPAEYETFHQTFLELHPTWQVEWWDHERIMDSGLPLADLYAHADSFVPPDSAHQLRSDLARYGILHEHGGGYLDLDLRFQKPIDPLLADVPDGHLVTTWERQYRYAANGVIFTPATHPMLTASIESAPEYVAKRTGLRANRVTGPSGLWTDLVRNRSDVTVLHQRHFCPVPWNHPEWADTRVYPDATAIHIWGHQRSLRGLTDAGPASGFTGGAARRSRTRRERAR